jgi:hypothetical protein
MSKIQIPKKIRLEDFDNQYKDLIEKIGFSFNSFSDEVYAVLNGGINIVNLNRQLVDVVVSINGSGQLVTQPQIKTTVSGKVRGINVINAVNTVNSSTYPTTAPFVNFTINSNILTILNVSGLQNNSEYRLTLELIV